jgi:hypothetical protein
VLYLGCQWKELAIDKDGKGFVEIHYTRIYRIWRRWVDNGCIDAIFAGSVLRLHQDGLLDTTVIHGDGTTAAAKRGGDNIGFSGHKKVKGDKVVAFCNRAYQRAALRIQDPRLHDDQSPALLPNLIFGRCRPRVGFHSGASRRYPACPRHVQRPPGLAQTMATCSKSRSAPASFLYHYIGLRQLPPKPATSC